MTNADPVHEFGALPAPGWRTVCRLAETPEDRDEVFRLRHVCYLRDRSIEPRPEGRFHDSFDERPNNFSFLARNASLQAVATVRITVVRPDLGWDDAPSRHVFGGHEIFEDVARSSFVEASRLCFARTARRDSFIRLLGNMAALADLFRVEWLVACPRVEHAHSYQKLFGFQPLAEPRPYFGVNFRTGLLAVRRKVLRARVRSARTMSDAWLESLIDLRSRAVSTAIRRARRACFA